VTSGRFSPLPWSYIGRTWKENTYSALDLPVHGKADGANFIED